jgi:hypothetical protein
VDGIVVFHHFGLFLPAVLTTFFRALIDGAQVSGGQVADCCDHLLNGTVQLATGGFLGLM